MSKLSYIVAFSITIGFQSHLLGETLIGDEVEAILTPQFFTSSITSFSAVPVVVIDPGVEFTGELSTSGFGPGPFNYSVAVDVYSDYFTVKVEKTNDWLTEDGSIVASFGVGGDTASMYEIELSDLDLPGGIGPVVFDPTHSAFSKAELHIREITWDTSLKQVNIRFSHVRPDTYAFNLRGAIPPVIDETATVADDVVIGDGSTVGPFTSIQKGVSIGDNSIIGSNVTINKDAHLGDNTVIGDDSTINKEVAAGTDLTVGSNVTIHKDVVIGARVTIGDSTQIHSGTVIGNDVAIGMIGGGIGVFIGNSVTISSGQIIGDGEVIQNNTTVP